VTGAARGVGLELVTQLASGPDTVVFAGVRNTSLDADHPLAQLAAAKPDVVQLVKITSVDKEDNLAAARVVKDKYGKVDVIIANAGKLESL
jgi:NAD(P)-dependent dehydrogenase (short-subunit alcohol dehydrogenase family)